MHLVGTISTEQPLAPYEPLTVRAHGAFKRHPSDPDAEEERERKQAEVDRQKALADAKARQADEARAKAEKAKQQADKDKEAQQAQNNSPVSFSAGQASWRRQPSFSCHSEDLEDGALTAIIRYTVDKQGNPTSVTLAKSTGNARVDRQLSMQAKSGRFNPFTKNGVPVVGIVNLPVRCQ